MKLILLLFLFSTLPLLGQQSQITITGKTNVNTFKCVNSSINTAVNLTSSKIPAVHLKVADFDCKNKMMTADFRKTLNYTEYPHLSIKFLKLQKLSTSGYYSANIEVKLMNKTKTYDVTFFLDENYLVGNQKVLFSHFGITPPKKMGGAITVKDALDLSVSLPAR